MTETEISPGLRLNAGPALFIESIDTLAVTDVHWGYAMSQRHAGRLLPLWSDDDIDRRLARLVAHYHPSRLVIVGDVVHDRTGGRAARSTLEKLTAGLRLVLVAGNHDIRAGLQTVDAFRDGGFFFHHGNRPQKVPHGSLEIIGHEHPAAVWSDGAGTRIRMPACVAGPRRIILPAFSPWAGGVPWNDRLASDERLWLVSAKHIFPLATGAARHSVTP